MNTKITPGAILLSVASLLFVIGLVGFIKFVTIPPTYTDLLGDKRYKYMETIWHANHEYVINTKTGYFIHSPACEKCR